MCLILSVVKLCNKNSISSIPFFPTSLFAKNVFKVLTLFSFEPDKSINGSSCLMEDSDIPFSCNSLRTSFQSWFKKLEIDIFMI